MVDQCRGTEFQFIGEIFSEFFDGDTEFVCRRPSGSLFAVALFLPSFGRSGRSGQKLVISILQKIFIHGIAFDTAENAFFECSGKFDTDIFELGLFFIPGDHKGEIKFAFTAAGTELLTDDVAAEGFVFAVVEKAFAFGHPAQGRFFNDRGIFRIFCRVADA